MPAVMPDTTALRANPAFTRCSVSACFSAMYRSPLLLPEELRAGSYFRLCGTHSNIPALYLLQALCHFFLFL
jgi:hypothetical protein